MTASPRRILIHSLSHACAALAAAEACGRPVLLRSPASFAGNAGPAFFTALLAQARAAHPRAKTEAVLDCGDAWGLAMQALRLGQNRLKVTGPAEVLERLRGLGARLDDEDDAAILDLAEATDPVTACRAWLTRI
ncbi:MAG: hypothetical protein K2Q10_11000 [Rhodospirillales bacterium]|nr:hypothetical protein [Rhodospirillales bacterium]